MNRQELRKLIMNFSGMNYHEAEMAMDDIDDVKALVHELRNSDSDSTCEVSDRIVNQILEYICK